MATSAPAADTGGGAGLAAHADWSVDPRKRWVAVAHRTDAGWRLDADNLRTLVSQQCCAERARDIAAEIQDAQARKASCHPRCVVHAYREFGPVHHFPHPYFLRRGLSIAWFDVLVILYAE